ncbi:hypothetical protein [Nocardia sp. NPDC050435]|uniref:hypothetical protein n=1 Tax=Nocardia sp. NPDC050435 TaxID=3155040 RepID=UPI003410D526
MAALIWKARRRSPSIDIAALTRAVRAVAAERPGHIYEVGDWETGATCDYVRDGKPSCLIAQAAARIGIPLDVLQCWDAQSNSSIAIILEAMYGIDIDAPEVGWLRHVQFAQDKKEAWGEAVRAADAGGRPIRLSESETGEKAAGYAR